MEKNTWPKYYSNQLIINETSNSKIALITGWTKKDSIWNNLSTQSKDKVSVVGQLYSKEGINFIIRNTFLNPKITFLIICGNDLSGSIKEFKSFLSGEDKDFIHEEIPKEKIDEFISYFSKNSLFINQSEVNSFLDDFNILNLPLQWTKEATSFSDHEGKEAVTFPSEKVGFRLESKYVSDLWLKVVDRIIRFGSEKMSQYGEKQRELIDIVTVIDGEDPDNPVIAPYLKFNKDDLIKYYPQIMTDNIFAGVEYTYGSRLRDHDGINQIKEIVEELKKENFSRRAIAFTWNVCKDCGNSKSPCLNLVQALVQDDILYLTAYFRSNDMFMAWPQNAFGLLKIQKEIASELNLKIGKMIIISCSAHIYERDFFEAQKIIENNKSKLECEMDARGNFIIETSEKEIIVKHIDSNGLFLQEFKGSSAEEIRNQIDKFVSNITHAIYLGSELYRAEQSIKNKKDFIQDSEF